jgi:two-component system phosphate regulon response regulator PhoB
MPGSVLIVDDEQDLLGVLQHNLTREGYRTLTASTGTRALDLAENARPDLILLDVMLPDLSGHEVCRRLRASRTTRRIPVLMLTARNEEFDRVVGFEAGADDYVVKPFSTRELMLRVRALLRRHQEDIGQEEPVSFGLITVDAAAHRIWIEQQEVGLTALEFRLLQFLLARKGRVQSRETLLSDVWGLSPDVSTRTVDTHVKRLREKLGPSGTYIETIRGIGYRLRGSPDEELAS